jgi:hypothetical protein
VFVAADPNRHFAEHAAGLVDGDRRHRLLVYVHSDHDHQIASSPLGATGERTDLTRGESHAPYLSCGLRASARRGGLCAVAGIVLGCARAPDLILVRDPGRVGDEMVNRVIPK